MNRIFICFYRQLVPRVRHNLIGVHMRKILSVLILLFFAVPAVAEEMTEPDKIDALLDTIENSDITLIRNGEEHDGKWAREHFEEKIKQVKDINTAEDFIIKVASTSRETGKPYIIKLKDGTQLESEKWLHDQLKEFENTETME